MLAVLLSVVHRSQRADVIGRPHEPLPGSFCFTLTQLVITASGREPKPRFAAANRDGNPSTNLVV
jgi:hypothetical protein